MIDEKKLIEEIQEYIDEYKGVDAQGMHNLKWCAMMEALELIERQPKVGEWISIKKDVPHVKGNGLYDIVRVQFDNGLLGLGVYRDDDDNKWWTRKDQGDMEYSTDNNVVAWHYLPESWKGEGA